LSRSLRNLRSREVRRRRWKPYQVFTNATLEAIVAARPETRAELASIPGIGPKKLERFGETILSVVATHPE
jgi:ATP-dependent DNA helicase RecQ